MGLSKFEFELLGMVARAENEKDHEIISQKINIYSGNRSSSPFERTRNKVYATGNKWAIENFNATH